MMVTKAGSRRNEDECDMIDQRLTGKTVSAIILHRSFPFILSYHPFFVHLYCGKERHLCPKARKQLYH